MDYKKLNYKKLNYILHKVQLASQVNKDTMEPGFTQEELNKITLSAEQLEHYSKPDELKRLLLERDFYKKVMETQIQNIKKASTHLNSSLDVFNTKRNYIEPFGFKQQQIITNMTYTKYNFIPTTYLSKKYSFEY